MIYICSGCKEEKLKIKNVKMLISINPVTSGLCSMCEKPARLYSFRVEGEE